MSDLKKRTLTMPDDEWEALATLAGRQGLSRHQYFRRLAQAVLAGESVTLVSSSALTAAEMAAIRDSTHTPRSVAGRAWIAAVRHTIRKLAAS